MRTGILMLLAALLTADTGSAAEPKFDLGTLAWLEGTWGGATNGVTMEEIWSSPAGGGIIGMHKDSKGGRMVSFEFFRVVPRDSGGVCYLASPGGKPAVSFCAIELTDRRVVFENREHDFPQRVIYWLEKDGRLHARIEGTIAGKAESEDWVWSRKTAR